MTTTMMESSNMMNWWTSAWNNILGKLPYNVYIDKKYIAEEHNEL